jgi:UDP-3-O-[3-hydroxymyristoyl] N-acetylglucosamine deacetylase
MVKVTPESFHRELAPARTFGFLRDVERLKAAGLARGGSLENAIVIDDQRVLNPEGLRFPDEFVRHKILDAIGDLSLVGYPILGHVRAHKAGHDINHRLVQKILANPHCWQLIEFSTENLMESLQVPLPSFAPELALSRA